MAELFSDTIFALSSGRLPSGLAVIRLSGGGCRFALETFCSSLPRERMARYGCIRSEDGLLDSGLQLFFPAPASFTGEDCVEFHVHGSRAVVAAVLQALERLPGFRPAEPGEFTRRAFLNGKMDLTEAEALSDLIGAETESQRRLALTNAGAQHQLYDGWRRELIHARALLEAELDFADEGDVPGSVADAAWAGIVRLRGEIARHIDGYARAEIVREGVNVVILGAPNAGKSSLLNALARRDVAIVSDEPGTTRDLVEVSLDLGGVKVVMTDTAGLRAGAEKVEAVGIERARARARNADLILFLEDMADPVAADFEAEGIPVLRVGTKSDLVATHRAGYDCRISVARNEGVDDLLERIDAFAEEAAGRMGETLPSRVRHVQGLRECVASLAASLHDSQGLEIRAEHLRRAADALGKITGRVDTEEILDAIFSQFCIGK